MGKPILVDFKTGKKIKSDSFSYEKEIQKFVENNMEEIFNIRFVASEVSFDDIDCDKGRIDSIGIDENNCPVIIEYKLNERNNIIGQSLFYLKWLKSHKESFVMMVMKKYGLEVSESIEWKPRIICIANKFDKYSIIAIKEFDMDITLINYYFYGNDKIIAFEYLNNLIKSNKKIEFNNQINDEKVKSIVTNDENYSEFILKYNSFDQRMRDLINYISCEIENISSDVSVNVLKFYKAFIKTRNFVCMVLRKDKINLFLPLKYTDEMKSINYIEDYTNKGHWGTGDLKITINSKKEFEEIFKYIEKSFEEN